MKKMQVHFLEAATEDTYVAQELQSRHRVTGRPLYIRNLNDVIAVKVPPVFLFFSMSWPTEVIIRCLAL